MQIIQRNEKSYSGYEGEIHQKDRNHKKRTNQKFWSLKALVNEI
jgi:hypothetical protein